MKADVGLKRPFWGLIVLVFLIPAAADALPKAVTFFPASARVTDVSRILPQADGRLYTAAVNLPSQAVPDSLTAKVDPSSELKILDQQWRQISRPDEGRLADLRRQLLQARTERNELFSAMQALEAQIQFWQAQAKAKGRPLGETESLAKGIGRNVKKDLQEKLALEPDLERLDRRIREIQEEIARTAGQKETLWEVKLFLAGPSPRETELTLTYTLNGCGWAPLYRLDAHPREQSIRFTWDAEIWQSSGSDWNDVETEVATLQPHGALAPPELPPWIIRPRPELRAAKARRTEVMAAPPGAGQALLSDAQEAEPQETRQSTFSLWSLGKRSIPAGTRHRLKIREENWPAAFLHLLRPSVTSQAFVRAAVTFPGENELPAGPASFLIDGALVGKRPFALAAREATVYFGIDPLVTARSVLLARQSGEKGLIVDRQTQEWSWRLEVANGRSDAVEVRLEEPLPRPRDERIQITIRSDPEPGERSVSELVWRLTVPGGQKRTVMNAVHLVAPKEFDLDLGWRR
jgi:uncharacterized protein (TIGR02231 family)